MIIMHAGLGLQQDINMDRTKSTFAYGHWTHCIAIYSELLSTIQIHHVCVRLLYSICMYLAII